MQRKIRITPKKKNAIGLAGLGIGLGLASNLSVQYAPNKPYVLLFSALGGAILGFQASQVIIRKKFIIESK